MIPLDPNLRVPASGTVVALPTGGAERIEGDLLRALAQAGKIEARVLQVLNQTALLDFLHLGSAKVRTEVPLRAGDVFTAVVEPRPEGSADPLKLRIAEIRHEPAAPLKAERLGAQLEAMGLPADAKHQAMARALLRHAGTVSREAMTQLNEALTRLAVKTEPPSTPVDAGASRVAAATQASAQAARLPVPVRVLEAAAFLVSKGLPVTEESVDWVAGRLNASTTSGERLGAIARSLPDADMPAAQALKALTLPDGEAPETAQHLAKLAREFTAPEARLARLLGSELTLRSTEAPAADAGARAADAERAEGPARAAQTSVPEAARQAPSTPIRGFSEPIVKIQEALTAVLERTVRGGEGGEPIREALSEVRFGQLVNAASSDPLHANSRSEVAMPLWWNGGSGEIRVKYQARDGSGRKDGEPDETRVVVTLDTTHLQRVKVDLLLGQKQLNCQVSVEDLAVADLLRKRLPELQQALEATGLRVNALGIKHVSPQAQAVPIDALRQVDVWL